MDIFFAQFLALLFPDIHALIDWSRGYESLDKEFQKIVREGEIGRRYVDKLVKVWKLGGDELWVLIHVEVQTDFDVEFSLRMYVYRYRIFDRYNKPVASLAVLADDHPAWRPTQYREEQFGSSVTMCFPVAKLLDFATKEAELEASDNPFAKVVLAHLKVRETKDDFSQRHAWKTRLVRGLFQRGFAAKDVRELFRVIDWLMVLPPMLTMQFVDEVEKLQTENKMPFITSPERVWHDRGMRKGIATVLRLRFGPEGMALMPDVEDLYEEQLDTVLDVVEKATTLDEVREVCRAMRT